MDPLDELILEGYQSHTVVKYLNNVKVSTNIVFYSNFKITKYILLCTLYDQLKELKIRDAVDTGSLWMFLVHVCCTSI